MSDLWENVSEIQKKNNIMINNVSLSNAKTCSFKFNGNFFIGIDLSQIECTAELRSKLFHEIGHCETNSFYSAGASRIEILKAEHEAVTWAVKNCVPFDKYIDAIRSGVRDVWQLSEYFDITIESAKKVIEFYECRLINFIALSKGAVV